MDDICVEVRLLGLEVGPCSPRKGSKSFSSSLICSPSDQRLRYDSNRKLARQNTDGGCTMRLLGPRARAHAPIRSLAGLGRGRREALRVEASRWNRRQFFNGPSRRLMRIFADNPRRWRDSHYQCLSNGRTPARRAVAEAVSLARCAQRGSRSHGRRRFRFCARRTGYAACARQTGFIACDGPSVIGYWLALVMAGANNRAFWPSGDKMND